MDAKRRQYEQWVMSRVYSTDMLSYEDEGGVMSPVDSFQVPPGRCLAHLHQDLHQRGAN